MSSTDAAKDGAFARHVADGAVKTLHAGRGHYKSLAFDDARHPARVPQRRSGLRAEGVAVSPLLLEGHRRGGRRSSRRRATPGIAQGHGGQRIRRAALLEGRRRVSISAPARRPKRPPIRTPRRRPPTKVDLWNYHDPLIQPMQKVRDQQERERSYRAVVHLADKRFVQLATPDLPNVNAGDDPTQLLGTSDVSYRQEISWDQDYNDVYLLDLKTGKPKKVLEHWGQRRDDVARRQVRPLLRRAATATGSPIASPTARARTSPRRSPSKFQQENNTPDLPGAVRRRRLDCQRHVGSALRQVRHLGSEAGRHRRAHGHQRRGARSRSRSFRYRSLDPEEQHRPVNEAAAPVAP